MKKANPTKFARTPPLSTDTAAAGTPERAQIPKKWRGLYERLVAIRDDLVDERDRLSRDTQGPVGLHGSHMADLATDEAQRDLEASLVAAEAEKLRAVDEAIRKIFDGTYGRCELTGEPIPADRLEAVPWARYAAEAEADLERRGLVKTARLGELIRGEIEPATLSVSLDEMQPREDTAVERRGGAPMEFRAREKAIEEIPGEEAPPDSGEAEAEND